jgi:hypothetical protein
VLVGGWWICLGGMLYVLEYACQGPGILWVMVLMGVVLRILLAGYGALASALEGDASGSLFLGCQSPTLGRALIWQFDVFIPCPGRSGTCLGCTLVKTPETGALPRYGIV